MSKPSDPLTVGTADLTHHQTSNFWKLTLGSVGVVYGDIGTSPLYALKESITVASAGGAVRPDAVFGVVSLTLWALMIIVTLKYVVFLLRVDNRGEGGILTLVALALRKAGPLSFATILLGAIGASLFYGDAIITPAISVLSAVEGLKIVTPAFQAYVLPLSVAIIVGLFIVQKHGTARVAAFFGPITALWFAVLGLSGLAQVVANPGILAAVNPFYGLHFLLSHGTLGFVTLGSVFLAVTGAEALYADLGHFGRRPIQFAWVAGVFPALALNYLGQGALLIASPEKIENPFFLLFPQWAVLPMVVLATMATVIASQAVITGAYSMTQQAMQLGLLPRFEVRRTSDVQAGQIYIAKVNWMLLAAILLLIGIFKTSSALASAYGIAVTGTMVATTLLAFIVLWKCWEWPPLIAGFLVAPFLLIDATFLFANLSKLAEGGWMPLAVGALLVLVMLTWRKGSQVLRTQTRRDDIPMNALLADIERRPADLRVKGTAVFLTSDPDTAPVALLHNLKHNKVVHEKNVILNIVTDDVPYVRDEKRVSIKYLSETFSLISLRFGYMETPNVPAALPRCRERGWKFDIMQTSFFLSRRTLHPAERSPMPPWQDRLFIAISRIADDASRYFGLPSNRVVEIGTQVAI